MRFRLSEPGGSDWFLQRRSGKRMSQALEIAKKGAWSPKHLAIADALALAAIEWEDPTECKGLTYGQWQLWQAQKILEAVEAGYLKYQEAEQ